MHGPKTEGQREHIARHFAEALEPTNPRFKAELACQVERRAVKAGVAAVRYG